MIAYKGFHRDLTCTMGNGTFKYQSGKTYTEEKAKCARTGFHAATNPLDVLAYYNGKEDRYFIVEMEGDVDEDGYDTRISAQKITLKKELSKEEMYLAGVAWIIKHPIAKMAKIVREEVGDAYGDGAVIVRGRNPKAKGETGDILFLIKNNKDGQIDQVGSYRVDGKEYRPGTYYDVKGRIVREKRRTK